MLNSLPNAIVSRAQLEDLMEELSQYQSRLRTNRATGSTTEPVLSSEAQELLQGTGTDNELATLRADLDSLLKQSIELKLTTATRLSRKEQQELTGWLRQNLHPLIVIRVHTNPELIGGIVLRTPRKIYDFSFRNKLWQSRHSLVKVLRDV